MNIAVLVNDFSVNGFRGRIFSESEISEENVTGVVGGKVRN